MHFGAKSGGSKKRVEDKERHLFFFYSFLSFMLNVCGCGWKREKIGVKRGMMLWFLQSGNVCLRAAYDWVLWLPGAHRKFWRSQTGSPKASWKRQRKIQQDSCEMRYLSSLWVIKVETKEVPQQEVHSEQGTWCGTAYKGMVEHNHNSQASGQEDTKQEGEESQRVEKIKIREEESRCICNCICSGVWSDRAVEMRESEIDGRAYNEIRWQFQSERQVKGRPTPYLIRWHPNEAVEIVVKNNEDVCSKKPSSFISQAALSLYNALGNSIGEFYLRLILPCPWHPQMQP